MTERRTQILAWILIITVGIVGTLATWAATVAAWILCGLAGAWIYDRWFSH